MTRPGPRVYADWVPLFERFGKGDNTALNEMHDGRIEWTNFVADRWMRALSSALEKRLGALSDGFQKRLNAAAQDTDTAAAMAWARHQLEPLYHFSQVPALHSSARDYVDQACKLWVERTQSSLEFSASKATDQGLLASSIRRSPLVWPPSVSDTDRTRSTQSSPAVAAGGSKARRQVLS